MTTHAQRLSSARPAPGWAVARWAAFLVTVGCVAVHVAVLLRGPTVLTAVMAALSGLCLVCLAPRPRPVTPGAWGAAMAMSAVMMLLHIRSSGEMAGHEHGLPSSGAPLDGLHGAALALNGVELAVLMTAVAAIGVIRRRAASTAGGT
ncbi:hypothetical protein [Microbacterium sp. 22242]|uniref:hypothetical protein n=1 Tax=Microbacterium sp. 22242 TaxID=3453896 RepID=UPI003F83CDBD